MRLITKDDFIEAYLRLKQRGMYFIFSKFNPNSNSRTKSSFSAQMERSGWWMIPEVQNRWNKLITGSPETNYENFFVNNILAGKSNLSLLSLGCGEGHHELNLAANEIFSEIVGVDLSEIRVKNANKMASESGFKNIKFIADDIYKLNPGNIKFDIIMFNNSLHHFKNIKYLLPQITDKYLKNDGVLVINEYVGPNRLHWNKLQINETNKALKIIPENYKRRFKSNSVKNSFSGTGIIRMYFSDPSEAIDSESIIPALKKNYSVIYEKHFGGNLLMHVLKDISHNFINGDAESKKILNKLFEIEDELMKREGTSLMMFGIYKKC